MYKLFIYPLTSLLLFSNFVFAAEDFVHRPAAKDPIYLDSHLVSSFKIALPPVPTMQSPIQVADEKELFKLQKSRSVADCEHAKSEVMISLESFFGKPSGSLTEVQVETLTPFFTSVRNDAGYFIQKVKKQSPRKRPFLYMKELTPCVKKETTSAYPSGHAALAKLYANILSDFFPTDKTKFEARANEIGMHRVLAGVHHPSDIEAGRKLADLIYSDLKKSKKYQAAFEEAMTKLRSSQPI